MSAPAKRTRLALLAALVASAAAAAFAARSAARVRDDALTGRAEHASVLADARLLVESRSTPGRGRGRGTISDRPRAESDLVTRMHAALHAAGIDPAALTQVSSIEPKPVDSGGAGSGSGLRLQQSTVSIEAVRPTDLARFLDFWRREEPLWIVAAIRLDHGGPRADPPGAPGVQERYTAVITLENVFMVSANGRAHQGGR